MSEFVDVTGMTQEEFLVFLKFDKFLLASEGGDPYKLDGVQFTVEKKSSNLYIRAWREIEERYRLYTFQLREGKWVREKGDE